MSQSIDPKHEFFRAVQVAKLDPKTMQALAKGTDQETTGVAIFIMILAALAAALGSLVFPIHYGPVIYRPTLLQAFVSAVYAVSLAGAMVLILHVVAEQFVRTQTSFQHFLRVVGYGYVVGLLNIFPPLGFISVLWVLAILYRALRHVKGLNPEQSVLTLLIMIGAMALMFFLFQSLNPGNLYGGLYVTPYS